MRTVHNLFPLILLAAMAPLAVSHADPGGTPGVLDRPLPPPANAPDTAPALTTLEAGTPVSPELAQQNLRAELEQEQQMLEQLPEQELEQRAEQGERAAQVVLAEKFAREATTLAFAPAAANTALSDAVRWYSLAASRGFPGAPSLDQAGVKFFPVRVQRAQP